LIEVPEIISLYFFGLVSIHTIKVGI